MTAMPMNMKPLEYEESQMIPAYAVGCITGEGRQCMESETFVMRNKYVCPLLQRKTLTLSSKAVLCTNIP